MAPHSAASVAIRTGSGVTFISLRPRPFRQASHSSREAKMRSLRSETLMADGAPQRSFGGDQDRIGSDFHLAEAEAVQASLPFLARGEDAILKIGNPDGGWRPTAQLRWRSGPDRE